MSNGTKVIMNDTVRGNGHKLAPWHGKRGTVVKSGPSYKPGTYWVRFNNVSMAVHTDNMQPA